MNDIKFVKAMLELYIFRLDAILDEDNKRVRKQCFTKLIEVCYHDIYLFKETDNKYFYKIFCMICDWFNGVIDMSNDDLDNIKNKLNLILEMVEVYQEVNE